MTAQWVRRIRGNPIWRGPSTGKEMNSTRGLLQGGFLRASHRINNLLESAEQVVAVMYLASCCAGILESKRCNSWVTKPRSPRVPTSDPRSHKTIGMALSFFARARSEVEHEGYAIMTGLADPYRLYDIAPRSSDNFPHCFRDMELEKIFSEIADTFPDDQTIRWEQSQKYQAIFNHGDKKDDSDSWRVGCVRYNTLAKLLMEGFERDAATVGADVRRYFLDLWIGIIAGILYWTTTFEKNR